MMEVDSLRFLVWIFFFGASPLWAQSLIVQGGKASLQDYEKYLAKHPDKQSYVENYLGQTDPLISELMAHLKKAQYEFLDGSLEKAMEIFRKIIKMRHMRDWPLEAQKSVYYAFFRRAQLLKNKQARRSLIREAIFFSPHWVPDLKLFPPPLVEEFEKIRGTVNEKIWPLPRGAEKFEQLLVNGRVVEKSGSFIKTHPGTQRFSFISNRYKPVHIVADIQTLSTSTLPLTLLAPGDCQNPRFMDELKNRKNTFVFYSPNCIVSSHQGLSLQRPSLFIEPISIKKRTLQASQSPLRSWIWAGVGVLSIFVTWQLLREDQPQPETQPEGSEYKHLSNH